MAGNAIVRERTLSEHVSSMNDHMEELAAAGEWEQVADLLIRRNAMLREITGDKKNEALLAARRSTERITRMAKQARTEVADKLGQLHRGKEATDSYRAHT
jgi:hypothetical protein